MTSFGSALLAVPTLSLFLPLKIIVPMLILYDLITNTIIFFKIRKYVNLKRIYTLIIAAVIAIPIGANLLVNISENILQVLVGIIVTISAILFHLGYKAKVKNEKLAFIPVGFVSGLLTGSVSIGGPPIILFLANQGDEKQVFRATLTSYFWILDIIAIFTLFLIN